MKYEVRLAREQDLPRIFEIYESARSFMASSGNPGQWGTTWPDAQQIRSDMHGQILHVLKAEGIIHGVFALLPGEDPTYCVIERGRWNHDAPYYAIHRVAGDGSGGIVAAIGEYASGKSPYLRIDTHERNLPMRRAVERFGFRYCGIIYTRDGSPRLAFDYMNA